MAKKKAPARKDTSQKQTGPDRRGLEFPTWMFSADGRKQVVASPQELEQLEKDSGVAWADTPFSAGTEFVPGGTRTFAAPVGTVDARGAAARSDRPASETALTTALPRNEAASVPSSEAESRQRSTALAQGGRDDSHDAIIAALEDKISQLEGRCARLESDAKKASHTDKRGVDSRQASAADARTVAAEKAKRDKEVETIAAADRQSEIVAEAEKPKSAKKKK